MGISFCKNPPGNSVLTPSDVWFTNIFSHLVGCLIILWMVSFFLLSHLTSKVHLVKAMVFPVVMYGWDSWTIKKAEHQRIDAFELWCWRRLLRVLWIAMRSIPFLSLIVPIFAWNVPLLSLIFLNRSQVFPILLFSSVSLHWILRKAFLFLHAILWNSAFKWLYLSFSPFPLASLLFSAICKASSDNHFAFLHFFFLGMVLIPVSCTILWTSVHSSSDTLSDLIPWIYLSLSLYNHKGFDLGHSWMTWLFSLLSSI